MDQGQTAFPKVSQWVPSKWSAFLMRSKASLLRHKTFILFLELWKILIPTIPHSSEKFFQFPGWPQNFQSSDKIQGLFKNRHFEPKVLPAAQISLYKGKYHMIIVVMIWIWKAVHDGSKLGVVWSKYKLAFPLRPALRHKHSHRGGCWVEIPVLIRKIWVENNQLKMMSTTGPPSCRWTQYLHFVK